MIERKIEMEKLQYPYSLPPLPYAYDSLKPAISEKTLYFHHDKHLQTYVDNLNQAIEKCPACKNESLEVLLKHPEQIPQESRTAIRNNGGGVYNHILYFNCMSPNGGELPSGRLAKALCDWFGSYENWRTQMKSAALDVFGSGYAWLVRNDNAALSITQTANQDTPLEQGLYPLLNIDVWEHAYYLDRQNRRSEYIDAWFGLINWSYVQKRYNV